jgi:hypothetical protein
MMALETMSTMSPATVLRGRWLLLARVAWLAVSLVTLALFAASVPLNYGELRSMASGPGASIWSLNAEEAHALGQLGLSVGSYAVFFVTLELLFVLGFAGVAGLIFWRKSNDGMALFVSLFLMMFGTNMMSTVPVLPVLHPWYLAYKAIEDLVFTCFLLFFFLFPNGRFVPAWTRSAALAWVVFGLIKRLWPAPPAWISDLILVGELGIGVAAQVYRYRRVSTSLQRQQTKWIVFGLILTFMVLVAVQVPFVLFPSLSQPGVPGLLYRVPALSVMLLSLLALPVTIGISILRYRLWDIDLIIRRTLIYGTLTAALALMYLGAVITLQSAFHVLTGRDSSTIATVVSTLAIAGLFTPVRWRIQHAIDRRFFRRKYDTAKTLAAFGHALRDEVELDRLSDDLLASVQEAMQPAHLSLWLRKPARSGLAPH